MSDMHLDFGELQLLIIGHSSAGMNCDDWPHIDELRETAGSQFKNKVI